MSIPFHSTDALELKQ